MALLSLLFSEDKGGQLEADNSRMPSDGDLGVNGNVTACLNIASWFGFKDRGNFSSAVPAPSQLKRLHIFSSF